MNRLLLVVLLTSCASSWRYRDIGTRIPPHQCSLPVLVGISNNIPEQERKYILSAFEFWNTELGQTIFYDMGILPFPPDSPMANGIVTVGYPDKHEAVSSLTVAITDYKAIMYNGCIFGARINLLMPVMDLEEKQRYLAMKHELGHVLGLDDTNDAKSIMNGSLPRFWDPFPIHLLPEELEALYLFYPRK